MKVDKFTLSVINTIRTLMDENDVTIIKFDILANEYWLDMSKWAQWLLDIGINGICIYNDTLELIVNDSNSYTDLKKCCIIYTPSFHAQTLLNILDVIYNTLDEKNFVTRVQYDNKMFNQYKLSHIKTLDSHLESIILGHLTSILRQLFKIY